MLRVLKRKGRQLTRGGMGVACGGVRKGGKLTGWRKDFEISDESPLCLFAGRREQVVWEDEDGSYRPYVSMSC